MNTPRACRFVVNLWNIFAATVAPPLSRELADPQALIGHRPCRACDALLVHGPLIFIAVLRGSVVLFVHKQPLAPSKLGLLGAMGHERLSSQGTNPTTQFAVLI